MNRHDFKTKNHNAKKTILTLPAIFIIIFLLIQWQVYKINHAPEEYTFEVLNQPLNGTADKSTPSFHSEDLIKGIANARLVKVEEKGHLLNWEAHLKIVEEIKTMSKN
jgi:pimeloyl-ACP methyl ester carboxylesterase